MRRYVALGLADTLLSGPATARSAHARCARALGGDAPWLRRFARQIVAQFAAAWHSGSRNDIVRAVLASGDFLAAWNSDNRPRIRIYPLAPPAMSPPPPGLRECVLPNLPTPGDIATWLDLSLPELEWLSGSGHARRRNAGALPSHYSYRWIAKRSGGARLIEIPKVQLRAVQRRILRRLLEFIPPHECAHGFRARHSCITNAQPHVASKVVIRMDLQDFFTSIGGGRVYALFAALGFPEAAARTLTRLTTNLAPERQVIAHPLHGERSGVQQPEWRSRQRLQAPHLPQGAPTSPAIANLCAFNLDLRLQALAERFDARYTRYADDLTFSGGSFLERVTEDFPAFVGAIALEEGFAINFRKTRIMTRAARQQVTGIVVNERLNTRRSEFDRLKAILHNSLKHGLATQNRTGAPDFRRHLAGRIAQIAAINPDRGRRLRALYERLV